jgi:hypothetical protein
MNDEPVGTHVAIGSHPFISRSIPYNSELASLFTEEQLQHDGYFGYHYYSIAIDELRDRLQLRGFTSRYAREALNAEVEALNAKLDKENYLLDDPYESAEEKLTVLKLYLNTPRNINSPAYPHPEEVLDVSGIGILTSLRLAIDLIEDRSKQVTYFLHDRVVAKLPVTESRPLSDLAREERRTNAAHDAPLVVLTEGSTDSQILSSAAAVTHPHLAGFLRFMDFSAGAEGSAANLARLVRSFAGAGIANRVVAIADNDTAAHDALDRLRLEGLPDGYRIVYYPDLPLLANYPTLGPQFGEPVIMDVNGKAGSLEMYLGRELLTVHGQLIPCSGQAM